MKKILIIISLTINSVISFGQFKSLDIGDTTNYTEIKNFISELNNFGYNYVGKNVILNCKFRKINNDNLSNTPEANKGRSSEGGMSYYDPKKVRELVGFTIDEEQSDIYFYKSYGYQKDILDNLKNFKEDDNIVVLGKVVQWNDGEKVGIRVKYVYNLDLYNSSVNNENNSNITSGVTKEKSLTDILFEKGIMIAIIFILILIVSYFIKRKKG